MGRRDCRMFSYSIIVVVLHLVSLLSIFISLYQTDLFVVLSLVTRFGWTRFRLASDRTRFGVVLITDFDVLEFVSMAILRFIQACLEITTPSSNESSLGTFWLVSFRLGFEPQLPPTLLLSIANSVASPVRDRTLQR